MKERYLHFDILKGIAILLVVLGHIFWFSGVPNRYTQSILWNLLVSVHMPIFIFISGYFSVKALDLSKNGVFKYWKDKSIRLLLPLLFCPVIMDWVISGFSLRLPFMTQYYGRYWFTLVLFKLFVIFYAFRLGFYLIGSLLKKVKILGGGGELAYYLSSIILLSLLLKIPTHFGVKVPVIIMHNVNWLYKYLVLGYLFASYPIIQKFFKDERVIAICFIGFISLLSTEFIVFNSSHPFTKGLLAPQSILGIITFYAISRNLAEKNNKVSKGLAYLGKESLPIYLTHYFFLPFFPWMNIKTNKFLAFLIYGEKIK